MGSITYKISTYLLVSSKKLSVKSDELCLMMLYPDLIVSPQFTVKGGALVCCEIELFDRFSDPNE